MKLLLDTHIWLWSLLEPSRLTGRVSSLLEAEDSEIWLSPISIWEVYHLAERGRIRLEIDARSWIDLALERLSIREATLTFEVVRAAEALVLPHRDPADRFILASAKVFDLTLVTADRRLLQIRAASMIANR